MSSSRIGTLTPALVAVLLGGCREKPPVDTVQVSSFGSAQRAVILVMDGVRVEESFGGGDTEALGTSDATGAPTVESLPLMRAELFPHGALVAPAYVTGETVTTASHAAMLTGQRIPHVPMGSNAGVGLRRIDYPTLFEVLRDTEGAELDDVHFLGNTEIIADLVSSWHPGFGDDVQGSLTILFDAEDPSQFSHNDEDVVELVKDTLDGGARYVLANLHETDRAGHETPQRYAAAVEQDDRPISSLWSWIQAQDELKDDTLLVVMSDHGRHRFVEGELPWAHHGCNCSGCREIPILLLGPGVRQDYIGSGPYILPDMARTTSWLMGIDQPYNTGLLMSELLEDEPLVKERSGVVRLSSSGDLVGWQRWEPGFDVRSSVVVDDEVLATGIMHSEEPRVVRAPGVDYACWRQFDLRPGDDEMPWEGACSRREAGGAWEPIGFPASTAMPDLTSTMVVDDEGRLLILYIDTLKHPMLYGFTASDSWITAAVWSEEAGWATADNDTGYERYPLSPSMVFDDGQATAVFVASDNTQQMRYTRHLELANISIDDGTPTWRELGTIDPADASGHAYGRVTRPALTLLDGVLHLACLANTEEQEGTFLLTAASTDGGRSWSELLTLDDSGSIYAHTTPSWGPDGVLHWARMSSARTVEICHATAGAEDYACADSHSDWIDSLTAGAGGAWASLSDDGQQWDKAWTTF